MQNLTLDELNDIWDKNKLLDKKMKVEINEVMQLGRDARKIQDQETREMRIGEFNENLERWDKIQHVLTAGQDYFKKDLKDMIESLDSKSKSQKEKKSNIEKV